MAEPKRDPWLGALVSGKYRIDRVVGRGGSGTVYEAFHLGLDRKVALKVLDLDDLGGPAASSEEARIRRQDRIGRFLDEGRIATRLKHPNIAAAFDVGLHEDAPYLVMEWCEGQSLRDWLASRPAPALPLAEALTIVMPIAAALAHAHDQGVVHRDIKPANIMLDRSTGAVTPKIVDFGIAKLMPEASSAGSGETRTASGESPRTPAYAAPEQIAGARTGPWTDVHALGLLFVELVTGRLPYEGDLASGLAVIDPVRPSPARRGVDVGAFEAVIVKAVSLRPNERFEDASALAAALEHATKSLGLATTALALPVRSTERVAIVERPATPRLAVETDRTAPPSSHTLRTGLGRSVAPSEPGPSHSRRRIVYGLGAALVAGAAGALVLGTRRWGSNDTPARPAEPDASASPSASAAEPAAPVTSLGALSAAELERRVASTGVRTAGVSSHDASGGAMRAVNIAASDTEYGIAWTQGLGAAVPETRRKADAMGLVEQFLFANKKVSTAYAIDRQGTVLVVQYPGDKPAVTVLRDAITRGIELEVVGDTIGGPDPVAAARTPAPVPLTARRLRDLTAEELHTRIRNRYGRAIVHSTGELANIQVKVGNDYGMVSLYRTGGEYLVSGMRQSGEAAAFAADGDVTIVSRGTGPFGTREVLAAILDGLPAKVEVLKPAPTP